MKLCYVDESGNQDADPCFVMVGLMVDSQRLNRTREEFSDIFTEIQALFQENLQELKGSKILFGRDRWKKVDADRRKQLVGSLVQWVVDRKHTLLISAIGRDAHNRIDKTNLPECVSDLWLSAGLHIALQVQKINQGESGNKGNTFLVFDDNKQKADKFADLLWDPPNWSDSFYAKGKKDERLNQLIDTAFTVRSQHAGLVQVADLYAFLFRRYVELHDYNSPQEWNGEQTLIDDYVKTLQSRLKSTSSRWPKRPGCPCTQFFNALAPASLIAM